MLKTQDEEDPNQITYYLPLDNSGRPKLALDQILQAERDSILRIELMNGLEITNNINLVTNAQESFPYELQERLLIQKDLNRDDFSPFVFQPTEISTSIIYEVKLERTGSIQFFFFYSEPNTDNQKSTIPFYITVLPKVVIQGKEILLDDIQLQTILSKSLGKVNEIEKYFQEASRLKYNFVHFTPIQQLGISESLYCLRDNTKINNIFFDSDNLSEDQKTKLMKEQLDKGRDIYGVGSLVDIVLNHASDNSEWLEKHPECGYNLENCPWLNCAYAFDCVLQEYSNNFCDCKTSRRCQPFVNNEKDLNDIMGDLWNIVNRANLVEYFMMNFDQNKQLLNNFYEKFQRDRNAFTHRINSLHIGNDHEAMEYIFNNCLDEIGYARNGVKIIPEKFGCCLIKLFNYNINNKNSFFGKAEQFMRQCNDRWRGMIPSWIEGGMNNIRGGMHWEFIQNHNKAVRRKKPLISPYFAVFDKDDKRKIFACNGWVGESEDPNNPAPDFTVKGTYYYFKRKINIWSDCPKLNYGKSPSDCPYLMKHMTKYVQQMAKMFNGFRLDNAHSTPIFVAEYLAQKAREVNPDLIIMAELFTKKEKEISFVNRIGINLLIRELIWCYDAKTLSAQLHRFGGGYDHMLGKIEENKFDYIKSDDNVTLKNMKYLLPSLPHSIIFDLTHDNETFLQKMNNLALNLTNMACNSFSSTAIGSTRGVDQLFPIQPSVVNEQRKYNYDEQFNNMFPIEQHDRILPKKEEKKKDELKAVDYKFDFRNNYANKVDLALSCRGWKPDINLRKVEAGLFSANVTLKNNQKVLFKFVINGKDWVCDDTKEKENDDKGNVNNVIRLGCEYQSRSSISSSSFGNNSQREFYTKDLKLLRRQLNCVRNDIASYKNEFFLHQDNQFLCIFRTFVPEKNYLENVPSYDGYGMICRTGYDQGGTTDTRIKLPGIYSEFVCGSTMGLGRVDVEGFKSRHDLYGTDSDVYFTRDGKWLNGFSYISQEKGRTVIYFKGNTPVNSVIVFKYRLADEVRNALVNIEREISQLNSNWKNLTKNADLCDINLVLYKCEREELDNTNRQRGCYGFDNFGPLCYAGISHLHKKLNEFKLTKENNTILDNIRAGDWLLDFMIKRFKDQPNLRDIYNILMSILGNYTKLYVHHKPVYITKIIDSLYNIMIMKLYDLMKNVDIINFSSFSRQLLDAVPQFNGYIESSRFKFNTEYPYNKLSLSAGLPHFSAEYMRCWGRDTFISFKGLFLIPGLFQEARAILINFASVMRHGLIPNLLDSGVNSRYNARDATWFFLKSVVDYVEMSNDYDALNFPVNMVFLSDDYNDHNTRKNRGEKKSMKLAEIVHDILQRHVRGISFREWRAGKQIDEHMTDEGFNIKIYFNEENGFIYGGNKWNCGTWMDKMGSSDKAHNKGHPATPRNGADCEIIGLLYYTLVHLDNLHKNGKYPFNEVKLNSGRNLTYSEWAKKIQNNFENYFFIEKRNNNTPHDNTYKDYVSDDNDFRHEAQLRCNIFVTLAVAPELFNRNHAIKFMKLAEEHLVVNNCIGIRTLDYSDKNYNGYYDVSNDSDNYHLAHGLNYHNGPEWVWPSGFYLMSKMIFNDNEDKVFIDLCKRIIPFETYILKDKWSGLPELTNKDGAFCGGSCPTQAWSIATMIEAIDELAHRYNLLGNNTHKDEKKKKKVKRIKHDEDKKDDKDKDQGDEEPKEVKKKKKVIKKVVKKHKKDKEEEKSDFINQSKEEPTEKTEEDVSKDIVEVKEVQEKEKEKEEPKEKKVKKVKKVIKKIKKKKTSDNIEEKKIESPLELNSEPVSLTLVEHDEKKEEIKEKKEDGPVKKKKKVIKKKKASNKEEEGVPVNQEEVIEIKEVKEEKEKPKEEEKEKEKKVVKKKKIIKKKKSKKEEVQKTEESKEEDEPKQLEHKDNKDEEKKEIIVEEKVNEPSKEEVLEKEPEKEINLIQEASPEQDNNNKEEEEKPKSEEKEESEGVLEIKEDKEEKEVKEEKIEKEEESDEIVQKIHDRKINAEEEAGLPTLAISNEVNEEHNEKEKEDQEHEQESQQEEQIFNDNEIEEHTDGEKKKKRKKKSKKKEQEENIENSQEIKVEEAPEKKTTVLEMITNEQIENTNNEQDQEQEHKKKKKKKKKNKDTEAPKEEENAQVNEQQTNEIVESNVVEEKKDDENVENEKKEEKDEKEVVVEISKEEPKKESTCLGDSLLTIENKLKEINKDEEPEQKKKLRKRKKSKKMKNEEEEAQNVEKEEEIKVEEKSEQKEEKEEVKEEEEQQIQEKTEEVQQIEESNKENNEDQNNLIDVIKTEIEKKENENKEKEEEHEENEEREEEEHEEKEEEVLQVKEVKEEKEEKEEKKSPEEKHEEKEEDEKEEEEKEDEEREEEIVYTNPDSKVLHDEDDQREKEKSTNEDEPEREEEE